MKRLWLLSHAHRRCSHDVLIFTGLQCYAGSRNQARHIMSSLWLLMVPGTWRTHEDTALGDRVRVCYVHTMSSLWLLMVPGTWRTHENTVVTELGSAMYILCHHCGCSWPGHGTWGTPADIVVIKLGSLVCIRLRHDEGRDLNDSFYSHGWVCNTKNYSFSNFWSNNSNLCHICWWL